MEDFWLTPTNTPKTAENDAARTRTIEADETPPFPSLRYLVYQGATGGLFSDQSESGRALASRNFSQRFRTQYRSTKPFPECLGCSRDARKSGIGSNYLRRSSIGSKPIHLCFLGASRSRMHEPTAVSSLVMVVATCSEPIPFGEVSVRLIFLIGIPKRAGADYLELISFLARHVRGERVVDQLVKAEDMSSLLAGFAEGS